MADNEKSGIERLRKLKDTRMPSAVYATTIRCRPVSDEEIDSIADQIEREAKRDLTDEAREAVERLRKIDPDKCGNYLTCWNTIIDALGTDSADDHGAKESYWEDMRLTRDRLCDLIEHGGRQDVDVAALRELTRDLERNAAKWMGAGRSLYKSIACCFDGAARVLRQAIENAPDPDAERDAAADWVEAHGGLANVKEIEKDCVELQDARMTLSETLVILGCDPDEIDRAKSGKYCEVAESLAKRLMPPDMEWPRFEDGELVKFGDEFVKEGKTYRIDGVQLYEDGHFALYVITGPCSAYVPKFDHGERVERRPVPEVRERPRRRKAQRQEREQVLKPCRALGQQPIRELLRFREVRLRRCRHRGLAAAMRSDRARMGQNRTF